MALDYMMLHLALFFREHTTLSPPSIQSAVSGVALFPCRTLSSSSQCARLFSILSTRGWNCSSTPAKSCEEDRWYIHLVFSSLLKAFKFEQKQPTFYRGQFEMHFIKWKSLYFYSIFTRGCTQDSTWPQASIATDTSLVPNRRHDNYVYQWWPRCMTPYGAMRPLDIDAEHYNNASKNILCHKGHWRGALMFSLICAWINGWENSRMVGDLRRHRAHYDVIVMSSLLTEKNFQTQFLMGWPHSRQPFLLKIPLN